MSNNTTPASPTPIRDAFSAKWLLYAALCVVGFLLADFFISNPKWLFAPIAIWGAWWYGQRQEAAKRDQIEQQQRAAAFSQICGPYLVTSIDPTEGPADIAARAGQARKYLQDSGNPYANQIPIVQFPYTPVLAVGGGTQPLTWERYQILCVEKIFAANEAWKAVCPAPIKPLFLQGIVQLQPTAQP